MALNLETIVFPPAAQDTTPQILRQVDYKDNTQKYRQKTGLITQGFLEVAQTTEGIGWGVSDLITFSYEYIEKPIFTWGMEGTYSGDLTNPTPSPAYNFPDIPDALQAYIDAADFTTYSPAIFIPRIVHWYKRSDLVYSGCFLLVAQVNSECTEPADKICRIHFRFEGTGYLSNTLGADQGS